MGVPADEASGLCRGLNAAVLTLRFARRFAAYKRPNLLLHDPARLPRIEFIRLPEACGRVVFIAPGRAPGPGRRRVGMTVCSPIRSVAFQLMSMASFTL